MKSVVICGVCEKPKRFSGTYVLKVTNYGLENLIEVSEENKVKVVKPLQYQIRACRPCTKRIGYKVKSSDKTRKKNKRVAKGSKAA